MQRACNANVYGLVFETRLSFYINTAIDAYERETFPISPLVNLYRDHHMYGSSVWYLVLAQQGENMSHPH